MLLVVAGVFEIYSGSRPRQPEPSPRIQIAGVSLDTVSSPVGYSYYLLVVNASNFGTVGWTFDPAHLQLTSNASRAYSALSTYAWASTLAGSDVAPGASTQGEVVFELPAHEGPARLRYDDPASGISLEVVNVPQPSSFAVRFNYNLQLTVNGIPVSPGGWTASRCSGVGANGTAPWICSLVLNGIVLNETIANDTVVVFSGRTVQVNLWFEYLRKPADPQTVTLQTVAAGEGFELVRVVGAVPQSLTGWGSQGGLTLYLKVGRTQGLGRIAVSEQFSA